MNPNQYVHLTGKAEKDFSGDTVEFPTTEKIKYAYSKKLRSLETKYSRKYSGPLLLKKQFHLNPKP